MPVPADTKYPAVATNAAWQKKKSILDKGIKTKVGPALVLAEQKWKAIKFDDLKSDKINKRPDVAEAALKKAKDAWPDVVAARQAVGAAHKVAVTQSNNAKLNSASRTALKAIAVALKGAETRLANMEDILPALTVDVNNATKDALATLQNLEVKHGSQIIATAKSAALASNKSYEVKDVEWRISIDVQLTLLQKKVNVSAHDGAGRLVKKEMVLAGVKGVDEIRLK